MKKEEELASTNKLLQIIRGESEELEEEFDITESESISPEEDSDKEFLPEYLPEEKESPVESFDAEEEQEETIQELIKQKNNQEKIEQKTQEKTKQETRENQEERKQPELVSISPEEDSDKEFLPEYLPEEKESPVESFDAEEEQEETIQELIKQKNNQEKIEQKTQEKTKRETRENQEEKKQPEPIQEKIQEEKKKEEATIIESDELKEGTKAETPHKKNENFYADELSDNSSDNAVDNTTDYEEYPLSPPSSEKNIIDTYEKNIEKKFQPPHNVHKKKENTLIKLGELNKSVKSYLGLDIGSRYIKYVQIQPKFNKLHLIACGIIELPKNLPEKISQGIKTAQDIFQGISPSRLKVVSSMGGPSVIVRHIKFPPLSNKEIEESIKWEAKTYIPFPLQEVNIDYQVLGRSAKNKRVDVLLVAVTKKLLQEHLSRLQNFQIIPSIIDINSLALVNAYTALNQIKEERSVVLLDIGASTTILTIYKKNDFFFTRDISIAGNAFSNDIQKEKKINFEEAEKSKFEKTFDIQIIKPSLNNLIKEIRRSLIYYENQTSRSGFSRVILSGGSCRLPGLDHYLAEELGLAVEPANPFKAVSVNSHTFSGPELDWLSPQLTLAFGLSYR